MTIEEGNMMTQLMLGQGMCGVDRQVESSVSILRNVRLGVQIRTAQVLLAWLVNNPPDWSSKGAQKAYPRVSVPQIPRPFVIGEDWPAGSMYQA